MVTTTFDALLANPAVNYYPIPGGLLLKAARVQGSVGDITNRTHNISAKKE